MFFVGEVGGTFERNPLYNVVVFEDSLDPAPEVELLEVVLLAEFEHCYFQVDPLIRREGLADAVDELEVRR